MEQVITQVAGLTKEVATTYIMFYGVLELAKLTVGGVLGYFGIKAFRDLLQYLVDLLDI